MFSEKRLFRVNRKLKTPFVTLGLTGLALFALGLFSGITSGFSNATWFTVIIGPVLAAAAVVGWFVIKNVVVMDIYAEGVVLDPETELPIKLTWNEISSYQYIKAQGSPDVMTIKAVDGQTYSYPLFSGKCIRYFHDYIKDKDINVQQQKKMKDIKIGFPFFGRNKKKK